MKKVIRLTENDLHRIVKNSVKRIIKEAQVHYGTNNSSWSREDADWNPNNDRGHSYRYSQDFTDDIKEEYVALAERLEKLTGVEWHVQRHDSSSSHQKWGYGDYIDIDDYSEGIEYVGVGSMFSSDYRQSAKILDKAVKMVTNFFQGQAWVYSDIKDGCFVISVYFGKSDKSHPHSRNMQINKSVAGYKKGDSSSLKGYTHPYPNPYNGKGAQDEEDWFNSTNGNPWFTADRNKHSVRDTLNRWNDPEWREAYESGYFDEY